MNFFSALLTASASLAAGPAFSQTDGRTIASINAPAWIFFGDNQATAKVKDDTVPGNAAIRVTVPKAGGQPSGASGQSKVSAEIKQGQKVRVTVWLRGVETLGGALPRGIVKLKDAAVPYANHAEQTFDLSSNWKPYSIEYTAVRDFPAASLNMVVQLALGQQTVDVGPATTVILP